MTKLSDWVEETRVYLDGDRAEELNVLDADYTAGVGSMVFRNSTGSIGAGAVLSVGGNTLRVLGLNAVNRTATVVGGTNGSSDTSVPAGTIVRVNPRFTDAQITTALNRELKRLSNPRLGLYRVGADEFSYNPAIQGYDLTGIAGLQRVLEVRRQEPGPSKGWPKVPSGLWEVQRPANTTDFPSGFALRVKEGTSGYLIHAVYAASYTTLVNLTDDVSLSGLHEEAWDIPPIAAAIRVMAGREIARNATRTQGDSRTAQEVPPGAVAASPRNLQVLFDLRVGEEAARLRSQHATAF